MRKVLYIDDEALLKMAFVETLKQQGYDARGALSGQEALDMIAEEPPDVIILDVMMKPMDGWETLTKIKKNENWVHIPVIMQTGKSLTIKDVIRYGDLIEDYLVKPVRLPDLTIAIDRMDKRDQGIQDKKDEAAKRGGDPALISEYGVYLRRTILGGRLIEILSRIYPIRKDGTVESSFELPELHDIVNRFSADKLKCEEIRKTLFE